MKTSIDRVSDSVAVLGLDGELDASNYRELMTTGEELYAAGVRTLVLDMSDLEYMSSSGIVALHSLALVYAARRRTTQTPAGRRCTRPRRTPRPAARTTSCGSWRRARPSTSCWSARG